MDLDRARLALVDGVAVEIGGYELYLGCAFAGVKFAVSRMFALRDDGNWLLHDIPSKVISVAFCAEPLELIGIGINGFVSTMTPTEVLESQIEDAGTGRGKYGYLSQVRCIGGRFYASGDLRQVYMRDKYKWTHIDKGILISATRTIGNGLNSIDGIQGDDIYAVGDRGQIFHYDGQSWSTISSPTNVSLERVVCVSQKEVYVCGKQGVLLRGSGSSWEILGDPEDVQEDFWGMAHFKGQLFLTSATRLMRYSGKGFEIVETGIPRVGSFNRLTCSSSNLWSIGVNQLLKFNGNAWSEVQFPQNQ